MSVLIRRAVPADAPELTALAHAAKAHWGYPAAWITSWRGALTLSPDYIAAQRVYAAEADGTLVGVCALELIGETWSLEHVWVAPSAQGRGVGRALVMHALGVAREEYPGFAVRVESDPYAEAFYRHLGARPIGAVPAPMPDAPRRTLPLLEFAPGA